eukprot:9040432-Alexandrium_andersonii.AAC.1
MEKLTEWGQMVQEYEAATSELLAANMKIAIVTRVAPSHAKNFIHPPAAHPVLPITAKLNTEGHNRAQG